MLLHCSMMLIIVSVVMTENVKIELIEKWSNLLMLFLGMSVNGVIGLQETPLMLNKDFIRSKKTT